MIRMIVQAKEHPEYGGIGLWPVGRSWADPCQAGMTLAHDILEHFPRDNGSMEHELMALGASLYVRDGDSYFANQGRGNGSYIVNIGAEGYSLCGYMETDGRTMLKPLPRDRPLRDEDAEHLLSEAALEMLRSAKINEAENHDWLRGRSALDWLRRGYRKAAKRYRGISPFWMMCCFTELEREIDKVLKHLEGYETFTISVNAKRQLIHIRQHDEDY